MSNENNKDSVRTILVCCGTGCLAMGSLALADALKSEIKKQKADAEVKTVIKKTGCNGFCENGPLVQIMPDNITYYKVKKEMAQKVVASLGKEPVTALLYKNSDGEPVTKKSDNPFYKYQTKIALSNIGLIDPTRIKDYLDTGGYLGLKKALSMSADEIISDVEDSGIRGRGGAGFPAGRKWRTASEIDAYPKYVCCNGDEGDPGAFMDRSILEGDPHRVLEGFVIAALTIGAEDGYFYIRDEYALALKHMNTAIKDAEKAGFIGDNILGTGKKFHPHIIRGGGAFVCGESTALMKSIEGYVGEPRAKYIRSVKSGLWDKPTVLNNVETLANIPTIIYEGGSRFKKIGTEKSSGTKVFALVGKVNRTGLVEVPMGTTLRDLIFKIGGGVKGGRPFKSVQTGGPSGGCLPESLLDLPIDFDTLIEYGTMMGSGGMIIMDDRSCMVEVARYYVHFLSEESCGKCTACREGLRQMDYILTGITEGKGKENDIDLLTSISETMKEASLCALGKSAANPVLTTIKYFRDEYDAHIKEKRCPAGVCTSLTSFSIDKEKCTGCSACERSCPVKAITGELKSPHKIDDKLCISCGSCREVCKFEAVITSGRAKK